MEFQNPGVMSVDTRIVLEITASLELCPRCLGSHPRIKLRQLGNPSPPWWELWGMCPATQEPFMVALDEEPKRRIKNLVAEVNLAQDRLWTLMAEEKRQEDQLRKVDLNEAPNESKE